MSSRLFSLLLALLVLTVAAPVHAQPSDSLAPLSSEFDDSSELAEWTRVAEAERLGR
jgi:hypothetical protein